MEETPQKKGKVPTRIEDIIQKGESTTKHYKKQKQETYIQMAMDIDIMYQRQVDEDLEYDDRDTLLSTQSILQKLLKDRCKGGRARVIEMEKRNPSNNIATDNPNAGSCYTTTTTTNINIQTITTYTHTLRKTHEIEHKSREEQLHTVGILDPTGYSKKTSNRVHAYEQEKNDNEQEPDNQTVLEDIVFSYNKKHNMKSILRISQPTEEPTLLYDVRRDIKGVQPQYTQPITNAYAVDEIVAQDDENQQCIQATITVEHLRDILDRKPKNILIIEIINSRERRRTNRTKINILITARTNENQHLYGDTRMFWNMDL